MSSYLYNLLLIMQDEVAYKHLLKISKKYKHIKFHDFLKNSQIIPLSSRAAKIPIEFFLIKTIISQQVSVRAAQSIWLKTYTYISNSKELSEDGLKNQGLSRPKASYIYDIFYNKELKSLSKEKILNMKESDIDNLFLNIRGVGPWTLCSLKMFYLSYSDVFITGDLAINKACSELMLEENSPMEDYSPYRTYLCLYLWESLNQT